MAKSDKTKLAEKLAKELLKKIGVEASVSAAQTEESIEIVISGENLGALIGYHGQTLESLQLLLSLMVNKETKETDWTRVTVDIGSYKAEREEKLREMLHKAVDSLEGTSLHEVSLAPMTPAERRVVHLMLNQDFPDYTSISEGEEPYRKIKISHK